MAAFTSGQHNTQSANPEADQEAAEAEDWQRMAIYTVITLISFAIAVALAVNFFVAGYSNNNRTMMIYSGAGIIIFATIGIAAELLKDVATALPMAYKADQEQSTAAPAAAAQPNQRAWIVLTEMKLMRAEVDIVHTAVVITNKGTVEASDLEANWHTIITPDRLEGRIETEVAAARKKANPAPQQKFGPIFPGVFYTLQATVEGPGSLPLNDIARIKQKTLFVYVIGEIGYRPTSSAERHWTRFCGLWDPIVSRYLLCAEHNSTD